MDERLDTLLASLNERFDPAADEERDVRAFLVAEGYEERWIGEVLARFYGETPHAGMGNAERGEGFAIARAVSFRVQGPHERGRFAPEAWGHLLKLHGAGMLSAAELEHVIERALSQVGGRIGLDDLRALLEAATGDGEGRLPGGGMTVH